MDRALQDLGQGLVLVLFGDAKDGTLSTLIDRSLRDLGQGPVLVLSRNAKDGTWNLLHAKHAFYH